MFLRNAWYVAAHGRDIGRMLTATTILDNKIVLFRTVGGTAVALEDYCPHRKLPLSKGQLHDETVECGYHGLTFDSAGRCVAAPTQGNIPPAARVRSYPLIERYGLIWIWTGEPTAADPSAMFALPNADNPTWGRTRGGGDGDRLQLSLCHRQFARPLACCLGACLFLRRRRRRHRKPAS